MLLVKSFLSARRDLFIRKHASILIVLKYTFSSVNIAVLDSPERKVTLSGIKQVLNKSGCKYEDGFACLKVRCPNCTDQEGVLYINKVTGYVTCMECQICDSWENLSCYITSKKAGKKENVCQIFGRKLKNVYDDIEGNRKWSTIVHSAQKLASLDDATCTELCSRFGLPNITSHMAKELQIYVDSDNMYVPLKNNDKHVVGFKKLSIGGGVESSIPATQCPGVIRYIPKNARKKSANAIVVDSVKDLVAAASGSSLMYHIVCLPHGVTALPQEVLPLLEQYTKIVFWFDNDAVYLDSVRVFSKKLGEQRCCFVRIIEGNPAPHKAIESGQNIDDIIKNAYPMAHECITTFATYRQDVLSELQNLDKARGVKWQRFPKLNEILHGHRRGELTVLTGHTGCGKTTFISEYSLDLAQQGVTTLWGSFEIRNQRLAKTMLQQLALVPLEKHVDIYETLADLFQQLPIYFMTFHGPQPVGVVMETIKHATYVHDVAHVIIDNLQFMMGMTDKDSGYLDRFYKQDMIISAFRSFATKYNCHVTLIIHPRKEKDSEELTVNSIFGGAKASQEADNILIMQKKMSQSLQIRKYLQVAKNRYTGDLGIMPLVFNKDGLSFMEKKTKSDVTSPISHLVTSSDADGS